VSSADPSDPLAPLLERRGVLILDGGLATELEARGHDLDDALWSARLLLDGPEEIESVHRSYVEAGSDCLITASYQASLEGFRKRGCSEDEAAALLRRSVGLARRAGPEALVAASVGPYGAYMADGSEYTGAYQGMPEQALVDWHRARFRILAGAGADLLACETLPSFPEACALLRLLEETPDTWAWFSFCCRDERHLADGSPFPVAVRHVARHPRVAAVGVNCTAPRCVEALVRAAAEATDRPVLAYPNSGEHYDVSRRRWIGASEPADFAALASRWRAAGASLLGGCCRTGPDHIRTLRRRLTAEAPGHRERGL
jgi:homocysteine S-methyltransferase